MLAKTLTANDFIYDDVSGFWVATVLESTHLLGAGVTVCKMLKRDENLNWQNTIQTFEVMANGDVKIFAAEPGIYRIAILDTKTRDL